MEHTSVHLLRAALGLCLVVAGCDVFDPTLVPATDAPRTPDRGPPRPSIADDGTDTGELVLRINNVQLNTGVDWRSIGRDLDGFNTTVGSQEQQCSPPTPNTPPQVDGPEGIDNAMGDSLLDVVEILISCLEPALADSHMNGGGTLLLWVQGWNGLRNDSQVRVSLMVAADATSAAPADVMWDATEHRLVLVSDPLTDAPPPTGASTDNFYVRPDSFTGGAMPIPELRDASAYIADGKIVYTLVDGSRIPLNAGIGSLTITLTDGLMFADLSDDFTRITSGVLTGRFALNALLNAGESIGICDMEGREFIERKFNEVLDVMSNVSTEANPANTCDAMSFGIPFEGVLATFPRVDGQPIRAGTNPPLPNACENVTGNPCDAFE